MNTPSVQMVAPEHMPALPDDPSRQFGGPGMPENGIPRFEVVPVRKADGSYDYVEYVDIMVAGDPRNMPRHKVTDRLRAKYRPYYDHWKKTQEMAPQGSPLEMWAVITPAQVHELKARNIFTVEQLAGVADSNIHSIPMGQTLRDQAKAWLKDKESADATEGRRRETEALRDGMRMLESQNEALSARLSELMEKMTAAPAVAPAPPPVSVYTPEPVAAAPITGEVGGAAALRTEYEALAGKKPFMGWDEATLREKIAALKQEG
jgi:hypothetical protein